MGRNSTRTRKSGVDLVINEHLELNPNEILVNERQPPRNVGRLVATTSFPYSAAFPTPIGKLAVEVRQGVLLRVTRLAEESALPPPVCSPQTDKIVSQITTYFSDPQQKFNFPVRLMGTVSAGCVAFDSGDSSW